jgi:methyltransferase
VVSDLPFRVAFTLLVVLVAIQRITELSKSARNERALLAQGAREHAAEQMPTMRALHASWLAAIVLEVWALDRTPSPIVALPALAVFALGRALRFAAMRALGERWTVKVLTRPGAPPVQTGVFRYLRHPNYLGVVLEIAALPLAGGAFVTAAVFSIANGVLLSRRIRAEEAALRADNDYARMSDRPRLIPRWGKRVEPS